MWVIYWSVVQGFYFLAKVRALVGLAVSFLVKNFFAWKVLWIKGLKNVEVKSSIAVAFIGFLVALFVLSFPADVFDFDLESVVVFFVSTDSGSSLT